jgi:hypothetical protein
MLACQPPNMSASHPQKYSRTHPEVSKTPGNKATIPQYQEGVHLGLANPPNLRQIRQSLFALEKVVELSTADFNTYWPYVSNVWVKENTRDLKDGVVVTYYDCRFRREEHKPKVSKAGAAMKNTRVGATCKTSIRVDFEPSGTYRIYQTSGSTAHSHSLDESDQLKRNDGLRRRVEVLVAQSPGTSPSEILSSLQGAGVLRTGREQLEDAGGRYLTAKDIHNWSRRFRTTNPDLRLHGHHDPAPIQLNEAVVFLNKNNWLVGELNVPRADRKGASVGVCFAMKRRLDSLIRHGILTLMDSTHKTNYLGWYLYTLMVRDPFGSHVPCAHVLVDSEDSNVLCAGLRRIKRWCREVTDNQLRVWEPRYILTDDSASEQLAVKKAFRGAEEGELQPSHLLCTVHSDRTLRRRLG